MAVIVKWSFFTCSIEYHAGLHYLSFILITFECCIYHSKVGTFEGLLESRTFIFACTTVAEEAGKSWGGLKFELVMLNC